MIVEGIAYPCVEIASLAERGAEVVDDRLRHLMIEIAPAGGEQHLQLPRFRVIGEVADDARWHGRDQNAPPAREAPSADLRRPGPHGPQRIARAGAEGISGWLHFRPTQDG